MAIQIDPSFLAFTLIAYSTPLPLPPDKFNIFVVSLDCAVSLFSSFPDTMVSPHPDPVPLVS